MNPASAFSSPYLEKIGFPAAEKMKKCFFRRLHVSCVSSSVMCFFVVTRFRPNGSSSTVSSLTPARVSSSGRPPRASSTWAGVGVGVYRCCCCCCWTCCTAGGGVVPELEAPPELPALRRSAIARASRPVELAIGWPLKNGDASSAG